MQYLSEFFNQNLALAGKLRFTDRRDRPDFSTLVKAVELTIFKVKEYSEYVYVKKLHYFHL